MCQRSESALTQPIALPVCALSQALRLPMDRRSRCLSTRAAIIRCGVTIPCRLLLSERNILLIRMIAWLSCYEAESMDHMPDIYWCTEPRTPSVHVPMVLIGHMS